MWLLHHKRKTNHEPFEQDRNELAIAYRLILGVLVSVFAATAFAADCKVNDVEISAEYVGDCVNGLAHGKGKSKGRDTYVGEFKQGNMHGKGTYTWFTGGKHVGDFIDNAASGFGIRTILKEDEALLRYLESKSDVKGKEVGDTVIFEGIFLDNKFVLLCNSLQHCEEEKNKLQAEKEEEIKAKVQEEKRDFYSMIGSFSALAIFIVATPWIMLRKKLAIFKIISNTAIARSIQLFIMFWFMFFVLDASKRIGYRGLEDYEMENIPHLLTEPLEGMFEFAVYPEIFIPIISYLLLIWIVNFLVKRRKSKTV